MVIGLALDILSKVCSYAMVPVAVVDCCGQDVGLCTCTILHNLMIQSNVCNIPLIPQITIATEECSRIFCMMDGTKARTYYNV